MKREELIQLYSKALLIRLFEEKVDWLFSRGRLWGTTHLCIGQEAVAVGVISCIRRADYVVSTHRGHGHLIAKGADIKLLFAELLGRREGYCMGKGGTQHLCVKDVNFLGTNGITGGGIPIATGAALSIKLRDEDRIAVCFFGDGASNQGAFHESLNMASVWGLPILYVCENNMYGMSTRFSMVSKYEDVAKRACAYGIESTIVDGMDIEKVYSTTEKILSKVRNGSPFLLEAKTYRFCGHSKSDPRLYRTRDEEDEWKRKDPIAQIEKKLLEILPEKELHAIRESLRNTIEESYRYAEEECKELDKDEALRGAYAYTNAYVSQGDIQCPR